MKLHRASSQPDWSSVGQADRNIWQTLAALTGGVITPGNLTTIVGFCGVLLGLWFIYGQYYLAGLVILAGGRILDLLDGFLADITGTKSPLGEKLDAGFDKLGTFLTLIVFGFAHIAPWLVMLALLLPHLIITLISIAAYRRHQAIHPSKTGKLSMAAAWVGLVGLVTIKATSASALSPVSLVVYCLVGSSILLGFYAASGYALGRD